MSGTVDEAHAIISNLLGLRDGPPLSVKERQVVTAANEWLSRQPGPNAFVARVEPGPLARQWRIALDDGRQLGGWRSARIVTDVSDITTLVVEFVTVKPEQLAGIDIERVS